MHLSPNTLITLLMLNALLLSKTSMAEEGSEITLKQTAPKAIVDWSSLNIESGGSLNLGADASIITLNSISNKAGNTLVSGNVVPSSGGSIVLSNTNGAILQTAGTLTIGSNFSAVLDTSPALLVSNVPEPSSYLMLLLGLFGLAFVIKARQIS